ncbi:phytoene desaturase, partial [Candidatus Bathyarchaeota archaeon]|nr:phytoene desaturase [Candidatus Bathyarchaeota archaeon]
DEALQEQLHEPEGSFKKYFEYTTDIYSIAAPVFLYKEIKIFSWKAVKMLFQFRKLDAFRTMHESNKAHFTNPKTVQLFDRYATYTGSSPYKAPATLNIIPHVEHAYGGWLPKNGIHAIPEAMARVARENDVDIQLNSSVDSIVKEGKKVTGVKIGGEKHQCDIVVANSDVKATYHSLLGDRDSKMAKRYEQLEPSSSGLVFYWGMDCAFPEFSINNILFSDNYQEEFHELFESMHVPSKPTVYINITSKLIPTDAPRGCENWFVLVNAPCNVGQDWEAEIKKARNSVLEKIKETIGEDVSGHIMHEHLLSPVDIQRLTGSSQGSLYGISSNSRTAAFKRQSNNSKRYKNLYFAGGSAHPGGGIPMVTLSGKICSRLIMEDHS